MGQVIRGSRELSVGGAAGASPAGLASGSAYLAIAPAGATYNDFNPGAPWPTVGVLDITPTGGDVILNGLVAGSNFQMVLLTNIAAPGGFNVFLENQNAGSLAANRFRYLDNLVLSGGAAVLIVYLQAVQRWAIT